VYGDNENQSKEAYDYMKNKIEKETNIESLAKLLRETKKYEKSKQGLNSRQCLKPMNILLENIIN